MNGSVMPLAGISCRLTPMLMTDCRPNTVTRPADGIAREIVMLLQRRVEAAQHDEGEDRHDEEAHDQPELLAGDREDEVGMAVGDDPLDRALARADAEPAAVDQRLAAHVDLERIAFAGQEVVDAAGDVREHRIGGKQRRRRRRRQAR